MKLRSVNLVVALLHRNSRIWNSAAVKSALRSANLVDFVFQHPILMYSWYIHLFQLRLSTSKAEKSNTSAKGCWEPLWKFINLLAIPSSLSRSYSTFPLCSSTTLIEQLHVYVRASKHIAALLLTYRNILHAFRAYVIRLMRYNHEL
jgi:hypothetical protein